MSKSTTIKRILKEATELSTSPSPDYHATPLESNLFEWHFTIRGPPSPSPFAGGIYHGRIILPPAYPLRPPSFRFLTPSGRFEVNREICLSISGHHEETWQPAWGVRTALVAIRALMDEDTQGQVGGMSASAEKRIEMAAGSGEWVCGTCGKSNRVILEGQEGLQEGGGNGEEEKEARELVGKIGLVEPKKEEEGSGSGSATPATTGTATPASEETQRKQGQETGGAAAAAAAATTATTLESQQLQTQTQPGTPRHQQPQAQPSQPQGQYPLPPPAPTRTDAWIDKAIIGIVIALVFMCLRKYV